MNLKASLEEVIKRLNPAVGLMIFDKDGLMVEKAVTESAGDMETIYIEFLNGVNSLAGSSGKLGLGDIEELLLVTEKFNYIIRRINSGYFLFLAMNPGANIGEGRYRLRRAAEAMAGEFTA